MRSHDLLKLHLNLEDREFVPLAFHLLAQEANETPFQRESFKGNFFFFFILVATPFVTELWNKFSNFLKSGIEDICQTGTVSLRSICSLKTSICIIFDSIFTCIFLEKFSYQLNFYFFSYSSLSFSPFFHCLCPCSFLCGVIYPFFYSSLHVFYDPCASFSLTSLTQYSSISHSFCSYHLPK